MPQRINDVKRRGLITAAMARNMRALTTSRNELVHSASCDHLRNRKLFMQQVDAVEMEKDALHRAAIQIQTAARRFACRRRLRARRCIVHGFDRLEPRAVIVAELVQAVFLLQYSSEHHHAHDTGRTLCEFLGFVLSTLQTGTLGQWNLLCYEASIPLEQCECAIYQNIISATVQAMTRFQHDSDVLTLGSLLLLFLTGADEDDLDGPRPKKLAPATRMRCRLALATAMLSTSDDFRHAMQRYFRRGLRCPYPAVGSGSW